MTTILKKSKVQKSNSGASKGSPVIFWLDRLISEQAPGGCLLIKKAERRIKNNIPYFIFRFAYVPTVDVILENVFGGNFAIDCYINNPVE